MVLTKRRLSGSWVLGCKLLLVGVYRAKSREVLTAVWSGLNPVHKLVLIPPSLLTGAVKCPAEVSQVAFPSSQTLVLGERGDFTADDLCAKKVATMQAPRLTQLSIMSYPCLSLALEAKSCDGNRNEKVRKLWCFLGRLCHTLTYWFCLSGIKTSFSLCWRKGSGQQGDNLDGDCRPLCIRVLSICPMDGCQTLWWGEGWPLSLSQVLEKPGVVENKGCLFIKKSVTNIQRLHHEAK